MGDVCVYVCSPQGQQYFLTLTNITPKVNEKKLMVKHVFEMYKHLCVSKNTFSKRNTIERKKNLHRKGKFEAHTQTETQTQTPT